MDKPGGFYVESHSTKGVEPWILKNLCEPIVDRIPPSITPNALSLADHVIVWATLVAAAAAPYLSPTYGMLARFLAAAGTLAFLLIDSIDGMHARRTGQTSRLGEVIDHGLDALNVPLSAAAIALTLQLDPFTIAAAVVTTTIHYHAQLVLYHHTSRFVHPTTNGPEAQVGLIVLYMVCGVVFCLTPQSATWARVTLTIVAWASILVNFKVEAFFLTRFHETGLPGLFAPHALFVLKLLLCAAAYLGGAMNVYVFTVAVTLVSFRITGTYVLRSVLGQRYDGVDWVVPSALVALTVAFHLMDGVHLCGYAVRDGLFYPLFAYLLLRNLADLHRHMPELREDEGENERQDPWPA